MKFMARILWVCVVIAFLVTEILAFLAFRTIPSNDLFPAVGSKYFIAFIVALPLVAGVNGYQSVRRRLASADNEVILVLSVQFLISTAIAYTALLICIGPMAKALRFF